MNKSAEILLNMASSVAVGRQLSDILSHCQAGHLVLTVRELTNKSNANLLKTSLTISQGVTESHQQKEIKVPINFYCSKLTDSSKKTYAYCLVFQPVI